MNRPVRFHGFAELELEEASDYYGRATPGLQEAFLAEVERGCRLLSEFPEVGALVRQGVEKTRLETSSFGTGTRAISARRVK